GAPAWAIILIEGELRRGFLQGMEAGRGGMPLGPKEQQAMIALRQAKAMAFWLESQDQVRFSIGVLCANAADAVLVRNFTTESFNRDKDQLRQAGMMLNGLVPPGPGAQAITRFFEDFANTYQAKTDGAMMWISATFRNETVRDMMLFVEQEVQKQ